ncbi:hypothetical protein D9M72_311300 [compost metagenome]
MAQPASPPTSAAMPTRAPTIMPAPKVAADRSSAASHGTRAAPRPQPRPSAMPPPSRATERRSSAGSVSARRILATASPDGKVSCIRSTSNGVYSMPTPTPNMPMHNMYSTSCHSGGCAMPSHAIACSTTAMPPMPATDAAAVWM